MAGFVVLVLGIIFIIAVGVVLTCWIENGGDFTDIALINRKDKDQKEWTVFGGSTRPRNRGWYLCTVENGSRFNMLLYWTGDDFIDPVRKSVFDKYEVMVTKTLGENEATDAIMPDNTYMERIFDDEACTRTTTVIAWKTEPRVYMGEVKNIRNIGRDRAN